MTAPERNQRLEERFRAACDHLAHTDPNDFDSQICPSFVSCNAEAQYIISSFDMKKQFGNPWGMGHGGILAAMIDCAQGTTISCFCDDDSSIVTISLQVSYIQPTMVERPVFVKTTIQKLGGRVVYCSSEAWQEPESIAATSTSVYHVAHGAAAAYIKNAHLNK